VAANPAPLVSPGGIVNVFHSEAGAALAPGAIAAIYGSNLASDTVINGELPLPITLGGTSVTIGGVKVPLYYVSPTQLNIQVPFELDSTKQYQVVVSSGKEIAPPEPIQLVSATPGLALFADGGILAQHLDGSLVTRSAPARAGEVIVAYLVGLGATDGAVASGAPSPADPLVRPATLSTLTVGGVDTPISFIGLTPGLVGLYQLNFRVPTDAPTGNLSVTMTQDSTPSNSAILAVQR
jgi:uncharacterized protein (TIGR03437 family)